MAGLLPATLLSRCDGFDDDQLRTPAVPSPLTLLGLVQHAAEVERNWFRRVLLGADVPPIYDSAAPTGQDGGLDLAEGATLAATRTAAAARGLDGTTGA